MRAFPRRRFWIALRRRVGVLGACLAYLLAALEIPLPVFVHKNSGQPFPCQDHACGCQTAEECWSHCCCFTPEERLAWAREHNVEPPAYAEKPTNSRAATVSEWQSSRSFRVAAQTSSSGWNSVKLRDREQETTKKSCCCACQPKAPASEAPPPNVGWRMIKVSPWRCQGYSSLWASAGAVLPVLPVALSLDDASPSHLCLSAIRADLVPITPPDPPPRVSLV